MTRYSLVTSFYLLPNSSLPSRHPVDGRRPFIPPSLGRRVCDVCRRVPSAAAHPRPTPIFFFEFSCCPLPPIIKPLKYCIKTFCSKKRKMWRKRKRAFPISKLHPSAGLSSCRAQLLEEDLRRCAEGYGCETGVCHWANFLEGAPMFDRP